MRMAGEIRILARGLRDVEQNDSGSWVERVLYLGTLRHSNQVRDT